LFKLDLLGGATLQGPHGPISGPIVQRRRLALLALLSVARDHGLSRDKTIAYLWPESPTARARHLLSESIYVIRKELGDDCILTSGDELRLNSRIVLCDLIEFEVALDRGDSQGALALYRGPFLDGFFLPQALEFEHWLEDERGRLQGRALEACELMVHRAEATGALGDAVKWGRVAVTLSDDDEAAVRRLIGLLARSGNRAGALQVYNEFVRQMHDEYELEPSEETRRLIEWIREWGGKERTVVPEVLPDSHERIAAAEPLSPLVDLRIAVFPFSVHGSAELDYLGDDLARILSVVLDGAGGLRSVDAKPLIQVDQGTINHVDAPEIAPGLGARLFTLGRVLGDGERAVALVSVYDLAEGAAEVLKLTVDRPVGHVKALVDQLALEIVAGISHAPAARLTRVAATTSASLPAVRAWLEGERAYRSGSLLDAIESFERATAEDPALAPAHYRIAFICDSFPGRDRRRAAEAIESALANASSLPNRDRNLMEGFRARLEGRAEDAERIYRRLVDLYPDDVEAWFGLAYVMAFYNPLRGRPFDESAPAFERARALDPGLVPAQVALAYVTARGGDLEALEFLSELPLVSDAGLLMRASRALIRRDEIALRRWLEALDRASDAVLAEAVRYAIVLAHDPAGAKRVAELLVKTGRSPAAVAMGHTLLAHLALAMGQVEKSWNHLDRLEAYDGRSAILYRAYFSVLPHFEVEEDKLTTSIDALQELAPDAEPSLSGECLAIAIHEGCRDVLREYLLGLLRARSNDVAGAEAHADILTANGQDPDSRALAEDCAWSVRAWACWWDERKEEALELSMRARFEGWNELLVYSPFHSRVLDRYLRGALLESFGRLTEAEGWYGSIEEYAAHDAILLSPALLAQGRIRERIRDHAGAARYYDRALVLLETADPAFEPIRAEARRRRATLRGGV
jgi:DNA-binding SARP family transcriptional activator